MDNNKDGSGEVLVGQTFVGVYKPTRAEKGAHAENFAKALEAALQIADDTKAISERKRMRLNRTFEAKVTFEATITVASPGNIGEYRARVTEK
jgi:hypothetical protein